MNSPQIYGHIGIKNPEDGNILNGEPQFFTLMREQIRALIQDSLATALHPLTGNLRFTHPLKGYRSMINPESLINWYIATEISANWDGLYSVYMYGTVDSPIYFGPLWDYDLAYGNHVETYNTRYFPQGDFYDRLLCENNFDRSMGDYAYRRLQPVVNHLWTDPWFAARVRMRYDSLISGGLEQTLLEAIDGMAGTLAEAGPDNYDMWRDKDNILTPAAHLKDWPHSVDILRTFVSQRLSALTRLIHDKTDDIFIIHDNTHYSPDARKRRLMISRTFVTGAWNAVCLPFEVSREMIERWMGTDVGVAVFADVDDDDKGIVLRFASHRGGLQPGIPYIVMPTHDVPVEWGFDNISFDTSAEPQTVCHGGIAFSGHYSPLTPADDGLQLIVGEDNKLHRPEPSYAPLPPYRATIDLPDEAVGKNIFISIDGVTAITARHAPSTTAMRIYDIYGRPVAGFMTTAAKGVYVVNGRKVVKK